MRRALFFRTLVVLAGLSVFSASRTAAQQTLSVEKFAKAIQKEMKHRKLRSVLVVDLANEEGRITEQTHGVTAEILDFLAVQSGNTKFLWARSNWFVGQGMLSAEDPKGAQEVDALCAERKCDALLLGRVQDGPVGKSVSLKIVNPHTKNALGELFALLPLSTGEPPSWTDPKLSDPAALHALYLAKSSKGGIVEPACLYCPDPEYSKEARSLRIQGSLVLQVVISREGVPEKIVVVKRLSYGLDRKAIEAVRQWKFKPARDRDGNPLPVIVPVEVTFRLLQ